MSVKPALYIGLMSGTSLDGVDGVLTDLAPVEQGLQPRVLHHAYIPFSAALRQELLALQDSGADELLAGAPIPQRQAGDAVEIS